MPNPLSIIVDRYIELTASSDENYKKHLRAAKELLILCDDDPDKACQILEKVHKLAFGEWSIYLAVKKYIELK